MPFGHLFDHFYLKFSFVKNTPTNAAYTPVLLSLSVSVINTTTKGNLKIKDLFGLTVPGDNPSLREVKTRAQAGTEAKP